MSDENNKSANDMENICVVCFKHVEIFSIGECDHPVCYECSTRMRVLLQQNECPICRQGLSKVIFTTGKLTYRELETNNRSQYYNKKYKICFSDLRIQKAFYDLLEHPCPKCNFQTFNSFDVLKDHVRREHELFYCDICTEHVKIFSFERKCYSRQDLGMHRRKGDPDNKSHRGHPLCQYCDCRYLDRDELFRHLRRDHFYCHFCEADGSNHFYADADSLREHFRNDHYMCEDPECSRELFTGVFRTDIDLKAHTANVHGKTLGKQATKQARTLQLEITLARRGRPNQQEMEPIFDDDISYQRSSGPVQNLPRIIDAKNEQEFPSLGGVSNSAACLPVVPPNMSIRAKTFGPAGLARTKENFPALGGGGSTSIEQPNGHGPPKYSQQAPVSAILKKNGQPKAMVIHVSNRPNSKPLNSNNAGNKLISQDFPALPATSKNRNMMYRDDDYVPTSSSNINFNTISAKHRSLVDDYVSAVQPSTSSKLKLVSKESEGTKKPTVNTSAPQLTTNDFPALSTKAPTPTLPPDTSNWSRYPRNSEKESRKSKVAPAPILNGPSSYESISKKTNEKKDNQKSIKNLDVENNNNKKDKKLQKGNEKKNNTHMKKPEIPYETKSSDFPKLSNNNSNNSKIKDKKVENNNETKVVNKNTQKKDKNGDNKDRKVTQLKIGKLSSTNDLKEGDLVAQKSSSSIPPPGFDNKSLNGPPPGFNSVMLNSIAKPINNLTFTSSSGERYSIVPTHQYLPPSNSSQRNQALVTHFQDTLKYQEAVEEFRHISQKFREGLYRAEAYYEHCQAALSNKFDEIFPELLVLLPDINKQQELFLVHSQHLNAAKNKQQNLHEKLEVCSTCKQVVLSADLKDHRQAHTLENNFPVLPGSDQIVSVGSKK